MPEPTSDRRAFLGRLLAGTLVTGALASFASIVAYLFPPKEVASALGPQRIGVGSAANFRTGEGKLTLVQNEPVWVVHLPRGFVALSALCSHKGCLLDWETKRRVFVCPCHNGQFDERGNVLSGLPRIPLRRFRVAEVDDRLYVSPGEEAHT